LFYALCALPPISHRNTKKAEQAFRTARERLDLPEEILRTIPKHKGTERIQAEIRSRGRGAIRWPENR